MGDEWTTPLPVRRIRRSDDATLSDGQWPATLAPVAQVLDRGLELAQATVVVGENGAGKSTFVEAVATAYGLSPEGGSTGAMHSTRVTESSLSQSISLVRGAGASRWGYFLRAETMHGLFTYLEDNASARGETRFHELSHGESFLAMLNSNRFSGDGFFVMDEPEAGLSFGAQLALVDALIQLVSQPGVQVLIATHSPVVASLPGATILEFDEDGIHERTWEDLDVVEHHRRFLEAPERYLRHLRY
ncbi:AAA family ATPase [Terrabacter aerolatus]|uniref:ABC transporter, ATP-binding protein n=1 Tax=Terrabacter aerolatus TaxID=422442 RepID=A0A512D5W2_9MICO|nr:AAA family ATPase [Terrabacter aerolatus]GEO31861.1 ABC transporter, ATP-binding protein [Terrabacter aerolatus]